MGFFFIIYRIDDIDELKRPAGGQSVNISSYTSASNYYECPSDGYVRIKGTSSTPAYTYLLKFASSDSFVIASARDLYVAVFVRKGAHIFFQSVSEAVFIPMVDYR